MDVKRFGGFNMSIDALKVIKENPETYKAYQSALKRIAQRDYSSFEMKEYLLKKQAIDQDQIDRVVSFLESKKFIDDERYLNEKIDFLRSQNRGNYRILEDLMKRGFSEEEISMELSDEDLKDYLDRGVFRAEHFLKRQKKGSMKQREDKLKQHLVRQGYDFNDATKILDLVDDSYSLQDELESLENFMKKNWERLSRRYDKAETKDRSIRQALSKGYKYDMIQKTIKELENEN